MEPQTFSSLFSIYFLVCLIFAPVHLLFLFAWSLTVTPHFTLLLLPLYFSFPFLTHTHQFPATVVPTCLLAASRKAWTCCERAPRRGAMAQRPTAAIPRTRRRRRKRTWCSGRLTRTAWQKRWWTWATSPLPSLHAASTKPCSKRTCTGWETEQTHSLGHILVLCLCVCGLVRQSVYVWVILLDVSAHPRFKAQQGATSAWCHPQLLLLSRSGAALLIAHTDTHIYTQTYTSRCCLFVCQGIWMQESMTTIWRNRPVLCSFVLCIMQCVIHVCSIDRKPACSHIVTLCTCTHILLKPLEV